MLPYTLFTTSAIGIATDKVMAPILLLLWLGLYATGNYRLDSAKIKILLIAFLFFFFRNISFVTHPSILKGVIWLDAINFGYFCLPILYINNLKRIHIANKMVAASAIGGCVSVFLVALKLLTLPHERFSQSRIGFEEIEKSVGLFTSYGDLAQYAAFFLLLAIVIPTTLISSPKIRLLVRIAAVGVILMGLIGCQSRSYLLSQVIAVVSVTVLSFRNTGKGGGILFPTTMAFVSIIGLAVLPFIFDDIVTLLSGLGGAQATATAETRLQQYAVAFAVIRESPILGIGADFFVANPTFAHAIHNFWLGQLVLGGIMSTSLLMMMLIAIWNRAMKLLKYASTKPYALVSSGYMIALLVSTQFYPADSSLFWSLLGINIGILFTIKPAPRATAHMPGSK